MTGQGPGARLFGVLRVLPALAWRALRAWITLEPADWSRLADRIVPLASAFPDAVSVQRLSARVLRAARRSDEAVAAGRRALALHPDSAQVLLELGRALRQAGQREQAIATLADAARLGARGADAELRRYAARAALPVPDPGVYARSDYAAYAAACHPISPPPAKPAAFFNLQLEEGRDWAATLASLTRQTYPHWQLVGEVPPDRSATLRPYSIMLPAGAVLDPHCLAWLNHAIAETGADIVRADHDHFRSDGERCDPVLLPPQPDLLWTEGAHSIVRLAACAKDGASTIHHLPLVLMTLPHGTARAACAETANPGTLSVIIPTRDNPALLAAAITSLRTTASRPDLIEPVIVDNGSRTNEALAYLEQLRCQPGVKVIRFDEPFNWSRANNLGAAAASGHALLFLNDDTEMQTAGWDRILAALLARDKVGLVGARMTYPDGTIQHGGFVFGMDNGPQHEGRWMDGADHGPAGRWIATRQAAGVTGAFMAMRVADFCALGPFDEAAFAVDFADLDLCLRVRESGRAVIYCGAITLTHHESVSRGLNIGRRKRRRMRREWQRFKARWRNLALQDPWYHPAWSRAGASYDGLVL